jgi:uncharacterized membrane protein YcaP (DUF421 family)
VAIVIVASVGARLFTVGVPLGEKVARTLLVYLSVLLLLRLFGKRTAAQLNSFDLVVLLLLSNVVQNAIIGPDNSLLGGLVGAATLVLVNDGAVRLFRRSRRVDRAVEGSVARLVEGGSFSRDAMRRLGIGESDLEVALRRQGAEHVGQVRRADLYPSGAIVVDLDRESHDASFADVERIERKLDELIEAVGRRPASP